MGKFVITEVKTGTKFNLKAGNGEIIATSQVYKSEASCKKGIASVIKNAPVADVELQITEDFEKKKNPKFEVYLDKAEEFRFRLKARNGEVIAVSEAYTTKANCKNGINSVIKNVVDAQIIEEMKAELEEIKASNPESAAEVADDIAAIEEKIDNAESDIIFRYQFGMIELIMKIISFLLNLLF